MGTDSSLDKVATEVVADVVADVVPPKSVGKILSEARISQGLSVGDVASSIKFAPRQIEALEADDVSHLPELAFVRGFVRSYARLLHIDETPLLNALQPTDQQSAPLQKSAAEVPFPTAQSARRINLIWLFAALGLAVVLGAGVVFIKDRPTEKKTVVSEVAVFSAEPVVEAAVAASAVVASTPVVSVESPVVALLPKAPVVSSGANRAPIHLVFEGESWVDVTDNTGKTLLKMVNPADTERWLRGEPPFSLVIGNASNVRLYYEDEEVDLEEFTDVEVARLILVE